MQQRQSPLDSSNAVLPPVVSKYVNICTSNSKRPDVIKAERLKSGCENEVLSSLRPALLTLSPEQIKEVIPKIDGFMTMFILIKVVNELKQDCALDLLTKYHLDTRQINKRLQIIVESVFDDGLSRGEVISETNIAEMYQKVIDVCWRHCQSDSTQHASEDFNQLMKNYLFLSSAARVYLETDLLQMVVISLGMKVSIA